MNTHVSPPMSSIGLPQVPLSSELQETLHIGLNELPWANFGNGIELQLLHVDLHRGLWVNRTRLAPGTRVPRHYHAGPVFAVTLQGRWWYAESPQQVNSPGSYLFEPAGSIHTLTVPSDQAEPTVAWFSITGPNIQLKDDGGVDVILDAATMLSLYRWTCESQGQSAKGVIVTPSAG